MGGCFSVAARLVQADRIIFGSMLVLEASASMPADVAFKVPIYRLRIFRKQASELCGLPEAEEDTPTWLSFKESVTEALQLTECHCSLENKEDAEVQALRLKRLCHLAFGWSEMWKDMDPDEYFRLRCFRTSWQAEDFVRLTRPEDGKPSYEEKLEAVLGHLKRFTAMPLLPECNWIHSAVEAIQRLQAASAAVPNAGT